MIQSAPELPFRLPYFPAVYVQCNRNNSFFFGGNSKFLCTIRNNLTGTVVIFQYNQLAVTGSPGSFRPFSAAINKVIGRRVYIVPSFSVFNCTEYFQLPIRQFCVIA